MDTMWPGQVIACLPRERTLFDYFQGHHALGILTELAEHDAPQVGALRAGPVSLLLRKPAMKRALALCEAGALQADVLRTYGLEDALRFLLGGERWGDQVNGRWSQTSRRGMNLSCDRCRPCQVCCSAL